MTDHKCGIGISLFFDAVFQYLPIFPMVLWYWVPPNVPLINNNNKDMVLWCGTVPINACDLLP